jgi:peptidoglycan hydrolase CwlO-like protein
MEAIDHATMAALVGAVVMFVNKATTALDQWSARKNGGTTYDNLKKAQSQIDDIDKRVSIIETKVETMDGTISAMSEKVDRFHRDMMEFREESRINAASIRSYLQGKKEGETNG